MMRRVLILGALLLIPALLAIAGSLLAAPAGPPKVDANPVEMVPGPDGTPARGMEPAPTPGAAAASPAASAPLEIGNPPAAPVVPGPAPPAAPVPVLPPVVVNDDTDDDAGEAGEVDTDDDAAEVDDE